MLRNCRVMQLSVRLGGKVYMRLAVNNFRMYDAQNYESMNVRL